MMILLVVSSCDREPELPVVLFDDLEKGAYPRLLDFAGTFFLTDVANSSVAWEVEFYDEDQGSHVTEYVWTVAYQDKSGGGNDRPETLIATIPKSEFQTNAESGLPGTSRSWTFQEVLDVFGFQPDDINGGDAFNFFATLKRDDGKEFNTVNTGDNIESSAPFSGFFRFTMNVICSSELEGDLFVTGTGWCGTVFDTDPDTGDPYKITLVNEGDGVYNIVNGDFAFGAYQACYGPTATLPTDGTADPSQTLRLQDACNNMSFTGVSRWGEVYQINDLSVTGPDLYIDWNNDYPPEAGTAVLTRCDGKDWPPLKF